MIALFSLGLWAVPADASLTWRFASAFGALILLKTALTVFNVPYLLAMLPTYFLVASAVGAALVLRRYGITRAKWAAVRAALVARAGG